ncbi:MAG: aminoacyl-tRNA hydrolase [Odoribacter sp.]|nr:aminoacyl-tRNA hydrolase [Odoribacter sp.]
MKYLIVGLGNIGPEYEDTRHNSGFDVLDASAEASNVVFEHKRYGALAGVKLKGRQLILLKPNTYMNLSGKSVAYWLRKEDIPLENLLVVVDDLALPFGTLRLRGQGSNAGHNGLRSIDEMLGTNAYARLRFGIGDDFPKGGQVGYVLGEWEEEEKEQLPELCKRSIEIIQAFVLMGLPKTMSLYNNNRKK